MVETPVVIVGVEPAKVSVVAPARVQVPAVPNASLSPKLMFPIVREVSRLTVNAPAGKLTVERSAVLPEPSATAPLFQLLVSLQVPPETVLVQVPSAAKAELVIAHSEAQATRDERVRGEKMAGRERMRAFIGVFGMAELA